MLQIKIFNCTALELVTEFRVWSKLMDDSKKPFQIVSVNQSMSFSSKCGEVFINLTVIYVYLSKLTQIK